MRRSILPAAGLIAALLFSAGCKKIGDETLSASLKAKIAADADLKSAGVEAQVKNGEVTLAGVVPSSDIELKAVKLANNEPGVKKVDDRLSVQPGSSCSRCQRQSCRAAGQPSGYEPAARATRPTTARRTGGSGAAPAGERDDSRWTRCFHPHDRPSRFLAQYFRATVPRVPGRAYSREWQSNRAARN